MEIEIVWDMNNLSWGFSGEFIQIPLVELMENYEVIENNKRGISPLEPLWNEFDRITYMSILDIYMNLTTEKIIKDEII